MEQNRSSKADPHASLFDPAAGTARDEHESRAAGRTKRPYRAPSVQKRRSLSAATLVSASGTSTVLMSGGG